MLQEAIDLQDRAVAELVHLTKENKLNEITFKAPTGSGKTFMMARFMNEILRDNTDVIFLVSTLSKGDLAKQNYDKFLEYSEKKLFSYLKPYLINSEISNEERLFIPTEYNVYVLPRDLYKKNTLLMRGPMESFLRDETAGIRFDGEVAAIGKNKIIYLIKDECHQATNNLDTLSKTYFSKTFNFSATPKLSRGQVPDVEITKSEAVHAKLIKEIVEGNEYDDLQVAVDKFREIKEQYIDKLHINPCMIIQISNKDKVKEELAEIIPTLNKNELKWIYIVNELKECDTNDVFKVKKLPVNKWRDYAKENLSTIDVVIFKLTVSEGWDIPRACMLYQKRDVQSAQLNEQVIGRVRRNPRLMDFEDLDDESKNLATKAYIWANIERDESIKSVEIKNTAKVKEEISIKTTRLKTLRERKSFDLEKIIGECPVKISIENIFDTYRNLNKYSHDIRLLCKEYTKNYDNWFAFNDSIKSISLAYNKYICDYDENMEINIDDTGKVVLVSLPRNSSYVKVAKYEMGIRDWVWKNLDDNDIDFTFDSEAEKKWAEEIKDLSSYTLDKGYEKGKERIVKSTSPLTEDFEYLWGKNYLQNSEIKFEYYLNGRHFSYPDFIMKDSYDNIHIFEVKSVNKSSEFVGINDDNQYKEKVAELKKCYKVASKLTGYMFYLPMLKGKEWIIYRYKNGVEETFSIIAFREHLVSNT
ncbi:MAG: DEAD/DEAH box helicase family protein [Lachnospiraceae bacterium]|nr:DEAD/DEAH box helicase family protein [Lachnospiraceae bacterium]